MIRLRRIALAAALGGLAACGTDRSTAPDTAPGVTGRAAASDPTPATISLRKIGGFDGGGALAAEITAYDEVSRRLFVVNGALGTVDVLDIRDPSAPVRVATLSVAQFGAAANSVAADKGVVAIAIEGSPKTAPGIVAFYRATTLELISSVTVGALPDMLTFTPDGRTVLTANEGEPNDDYTTDPEGSVSVIDVTNINYPTVRTAGFGAWNGRADELRARGVRLFGPGNPSVAQDLEPEYIAVSEDGGTAWVTLQENNALAVVDVASATVTDILPFGYKDHSRPGNGFDASDRDTSNVRIRSWPVLGMYQPDAIAAYVANGQTYLVTANEGDARVYPPAGPNEGSVFNEEARVGSLPLDPTVFTDAVCGGTCTGTARLGRLNVTRTLGRNAQTGQYQALYAFGARSISIWTPTGAQVWDSGDELEQRTKALPNVNFNASNSNNTFDDRSDNKGPEPEGVVVASLGSKRFAFVGLERVGGVIVYDVTNPAAPVYVTYLNTRDGTTGDRGPEGIAFIDAKRSPNKRPLLFVGHETSGTTAIYEIELQ